jgi:hypothetical protein
MDDRRRPQQRGRQVTARHRDKSKSRVAAAAGAGTVLFELAMLKDR